MLCFLIQLSLRCLTELWGSERTNTEKCVTICILEKNKINFVLDEFLRGNASHQVR